MRLWMNCVLPFDLMLVYPQPRMLRSSEVEAVKVHYLVPRCHEIMHELLL